jgi:hypothetical protein
MVVCNGEEWGWAGADVLLSVIRGVRGYELVGCRCISLSKPKAFGCYETYIYHVKKRRLG